MLKGKQLLEYSTETPEYALGRFLYYWNRRDWRNLKNWVQGYWVACNHNKTHYRHNIQPGDTFTSGEPIEETVVLTAEELLRAMYMNRRIDESELLEKKEYRSNTDIEGVFCVDLRVRLVIGEKTKRGIWEPVEYVGTYRVIQENEQFIVGPGKWGVNPTSWRPE